MARSQALEVQEKKELLSKDEKTVPARHYVPTTDIYETDDTLTVVMELPGVEKQAIDVNVDNDVLRIDARIDFAKYEGLEPIYTESTLVISPVLSPYPTRSINNRSVRSWMMAC